MTRGLSQATQEIEEKERDVEIIVAAQLSQEWSMEERQRHEAISCLFRDWRAECITVKTPREKVRTMEIDYAVAKSKASDS